MLFHAYLRLQARVCMLQVQSSGNRDSGRTSKITRNSTSNRTSSCAAWLKIMIVINDNSSGTSNSRSNSTRKHQKWRTFSSSNENGTGNDLLEP